MILIVAPHSPVQVVRMALDLGVSSLWREYLMGQRKQTKIEAIMWEVSRRIQEGEYAGGTRLPAARDLATALGVSRQTVRVALQRLQAAGLVEIVPQSGTYSHKSLRRMEIGPHSPLRLSSSLLSDARSATQRQIFEPSSVMLADTELAQKLGVEEGTELVRSTFLFLVDWRPVRFTEWLMPQAILTHDPNPSQWWGGRSAHLGAWLSELPHRGGPSAFERLGCRLPTPGEVSQLALSPDQPVIEVERWVWLAPDKLGCYTRLVANAALHTFTSTYGEAQWTELVGKILAEV